MFFCCPVIAVIGIDNIICCVIRFENMISNRFNYCSTYANNKHDYNHCICYFKYCDWASRAHEPSSAVERGVLLYHHQCDDDEPVLSMYTYTIYVFTYKCIMYV